MARRNKHHLKLMFQFRTQERGSYIGQSKYFKKSLKYILKPVHL